MVELSKSRISDVKTVEQNEGLSFETCFIPSIYLFFKNMTNSCCEFALMKEGVTHC